MGKTERLLRLANLLRDRRRLRFDEMLERLAVSPATLKRDLRYLRETLGTPVEYDAFDRTYQIAESPRRARQELPGLWFGESDLYALLLAHQLLSGIDPTGGLAPRLKAVVQRVEALLARPGQDREMATRIRLIAPGRREVDAKVFATVSAALVRRQQLRLDYLGRARGTPSLRDVSPQRLVYHRTWYLDAWCHMAQGLRRFALDALRAACALDSPARDIPADDLERQLDGGYGAFAGPPNHWAILVFSERASQWAMREVWHPMQRVRDLPNGRLELMLPYDDPTELVMDVLRYGPDVEVVGNPALRAAVAARARGVWALYA